MSKAIRRLSRGLALAVTMGLCAVIPAVASPGVARAAAPGKSATAVMVGTEWPNLDPALDNQAAADIDLMNAVYGTLFTQNPSTGCREGARTRGRWSRTWQRATPCLRTDGP